VAGEQATPPPRILCVAGSPRRHGNSERLLDACIEGAEQAGAEAEKIAVAALDIGGCDSCDECTGTGVCVIFDDMTDLYPRLEDADAVVIASPVYFASVPAQLKAFYDRCQPYWARVHALAGEARSPRRPGAFLVVRGGGDPHGFECAVTPTRSLFAVLGVEYSRELRVEGPDAPRDIVERPDALDAARSIGAWLAQQAGQRAGG
jgi:multimeric flavodoxin WrbA